MTVTKSVNGATMRSLPIRIMDAIAEHGPMLKAHTAKKLSTVDVAAVGAWIDVLVEWELLEERTEKSRGKRKAYGISQRIKAAA